jgi:hypothetical protein
MTPMSLKPAQRTQARVSNDGLVLLDTYSGAIFTANSIGAAIWKHLTDGRPIAEVETAVAATYGISIDQASTDIDKFIRSLLDRGLVISDDAQPHASGDSATAVAK